MAVLQQFSKARASARVHDGIKARPRGLLLGGAQRALLSPEGAAGPSGSLAPWGSLHHILATSEVAFRRPQTGLRLWAPPGSAPEKAPPSLGSRTSGRAAGSSRPLGQRWGRCGGQGRGGPLTQQLPSALVVLETTHGASRAVLSFLMDTH